MYNKKALRRFFDSDDSMEYGGYLNEYGPGGINDYNPPGINPGLNDFNPSFSKPNFNFDFGNAAVISNPFASTKENPYVNPLTGKSSPVFYNSQTGAYDETTKSQNTSLAGTVLDTSDKSNLVGIKNKIKSSVDVDPEAGVNAFNTIARGAMNLFDPNKKTQCGPGTVWNSSSKMCEATNSMDLMAANNEQDRGDWQDFGHKTGMFRYDQEGSDRNSRSTYGQYGGYMEDGGSSGFKVGQVVGMQPDVLEQFLAAGGEVEYI